MDKRGKSFHLHEQMVLQCCLATKSLKLFIVTVIFFLKKENNLHLITVVARMGLGAQMGSLMPLK